MSRIILSCNNRPKFGIKGFSSRHLLFTKTVVQFSGKLYEGVLKYKSGVAPSQAGHSQQPLSKQSATTQKFLHSTHYFTIVLVVIKTMSDTYDFIIVGG